MSLKFLKSLSLFLTGLLVLGLLYEIFLIINGNRYIAWKFIPEIRKGITPPLVYPGILVTRDGKYIYALNANNGSIIWKYHEEEGGYQLQKGDENVLSIQSYSHPQEAIFIDILEGKQIGSIQIPPKNHLMASNKKIAILLYSYVMEGNKAISAVDIKTGQTLWNLPISEKFGGIDQLNMFGGLTDQYPEYLKNGVLVFWGDVYITGIDVSTGIIKWQHPYTRSFSQGKSSCHIVSDVISCGNEVLDYVTGTLRLPTALELIILHDYHSYAPLDHSTKNTNYFHYMCYTVGINTVNWCIDAKDERLNITKWKIPFFSGDVQIDPYTNLFIVTSYTDIKAYKD